MSDETNEPSGESFNVPRPGGKAEQTRAGSQGRAAWLDKHLWQIQPVRDVLVILVILGVIYIGRVASIVTVPFLLAVTVAYLFEPVVAWLGRAGVRRRFASVLLIGASFLIVVVPAGVGLTVGVSQGVQLVERVAQRTGDVISSVEAPDDEGKREALGGVWLDVRDAVVELQQDEDRGELAERASFALQWARDNAEEITTRVASVGVSAIDVAAGFVGGLAKVVFTLFLTAFFYYFVCNGWGTLIATRDRFIPKDYRDEVDTLLHKFDRVISGFVRGRLTIALIQAVLFTIGYWLIGVPVPMLIGPAVAVLSIVPYLAVVGIPVSIILLYIEPNGGGWMDSIWWTVLAPTVLYNLGQWLDDYVWTPVIQGREVGLGTATILFATLAGAAFMGVYGLLLAIPLAACIKIVLDDLILPDIEKWAKGERPDFLPFGTRTVDRTDG